MSPHRYVVQVIHQVRETYEVDADSREEAWRLVNEHGGSLRHPGLASIRTDHGRRELWSVTRAVEDTALPPQPEPETLGTCKHCGTSASDCLRAAASLSNPTALCCALCVHPSSRGGR